MKKKMTETNNVPDESAGVLVVASSLLPSPISTSDPKWQVSQQFAPDKENQWSHPPEKDGWVLAHNMIRTEIDNFIQALQSVQTKFSSNAGASSIPEWCVDSIKIFWSHHDATVLDHHRNEDEIMNPFMRTRVNLPDKLEADHTIVIDQMHVISKCIDNLKQDDAPTASLQSLIDAMQTYKDIMFPHLLEEEMIALPLLRAYFTPKEVEKVLFQILKKIKKSESGSFVDTMGEDYFRSVFMKQENIPFFVWNLKFKGDHQYFVKHVRSHLDALKQGDQGILLVQGRTSRWRLCGY